MSNTEPKYRQVKCITRSSINGSYEHITHIGGTEIDDASWYFTKDQAIEYIDSKEYAFFVQEDHNIAWVKVAKLENGQKYLRTENDDTDVNNLLSLPEC